MRNVEAYLAHIYLHETKQTKEKLSAVVYQKPKLFLTRIHMQTQKAICRNRFLMQNKFVDNKQENQ